MGAAGDLLLFTAFRYSFLACHLLLVSAYAFGTWTTATSSRTSQSTRFVWMS